MTETITIVLNILYTSMLRSRCFAIKWNKNFYLNVKCIVGSNPIPSFFLFWKTTTIYILGGIMIQVNCRNCQKQFTTSEKTRLFCNQSCSAKFNNIVRSKKPCKKCLNCLKILSSNKKIYCDNIWANNFHQKI